MPDNDVHDDTAEGQILMVQAVMRMKFHVV